MTVYKKEFITLFLGDILVLLFSLILALLIRYQGDFSKDIFLSHLAPFSILFVLSILIFFISGLYEKHTVIFKSKVSGFIIRAQIVNALFAVLLFYFVPAFGITPKINLFLYLVIASICMIGWRMLGFSFFAYKKKENAIFIGSGKEIEELVHEINNNDRYGMRVVLVEGKLDATEENLRKVILEKNVSLIALNLHDNGFEAHMPTLYNYLFKGIRIVDVSDLYEEIFDRIPLSLINYNWIIEYINPRKKVWYEFCKRAIDIILAIIGSILTTIFIIPLVWILIRLDDQGPLFSFQTRTGKDNKNVKIIKFRTMTSANDEAKWGVVENKVTRIGSFLRKSRIDELPQFFNVLKGDVSIIGPRPEFPGPVEIYAKEILYYNVRHIVKPGLSGWAQLYGEHPHHGIGIEETKNKLAYDLYYLKHCSVMLDIRIILRTLKVVISFVGR